MSEVSTGTGAGNQYACHASGRIDALRDAALASPPRLLNGIRYLEVAPGHRRLEVHFVHPLSLVPTTPLTASNVEIHGGVRVRDPRVTGVSIHDDVMTVEVAAAGDFSRYVLRLVADAGGDAPPDGIDPALSEVEFGFRVDCPSDFDCQAETECTTDAVATPPIDYLARDYESFRRLLLDRLATTLPQWRERHAADAWMAVVEAIAYRGDELSYFQDAVATEAYLGTARQRVSVRRHARLVDYPFHDGRNARAWIAFEVDDAADGATLPGGDETTGLGGTPLLTRSTGAPTSVSIDAAQPLFDAGAAVFELLDPVTLHRAHNRIAFHTWSDDECCLPTGATRAFLRDDDTHRLRLRRGDVLILEATLSTTTGLAVDADRMQRHAVRLVRVDPEAPLADGIRGAPAARRDPVTDDPFVEVQWADDDAPPFALCLSKRIGGTMVRDMAHACGNVARADHGRTLPSVQPLVGVPGGRVPHYRLAEATIAPLTQQGRPCRIAGDTTVGAASIESAAASMALDVDESRPAIDVRSAGDRRRWTARRDLLASDGEAADFVVEVDDDGQPMLRFGDGIQGREPDADLRARVRIGNGAAGNVGADAIAHVVTDIAGVLSVRNPIAATGGLDPVSLARVRLDAPQAFRRQERAVTASDYAEVVAREPRVQRAVATRRWTGSWTTVFVTVDRRGGDAIDAAFEAELRDFIERYRLAGHDVEIDAPRFVALDIALHVCTQPGYFAADVERRLQRAFSSGRLADGSPAFFHPDRFSFGQPVYSSAIVATAMQATGVAFVVPTVFQRLGRKPQGEIDAGRIAIGRLEIARLDNDPNAPENGRIRFLIDETKASA